jgi:hypothetical protein
MGLNTSEALMQWLLETPDVQETFVRWREGGREGGRENWQRMNGRQWRLGCVGLRLTPPWKGEERRLVPLSEQEGEEEE